MKRRPVIINLFLVLMLFSCGTQKKTEEKPPEENTYIVVNQQQFETEKMLFGKLTTAPFNRVISCNGNIQAKPSGNAQINTPIAGLINKIYISPGQRVTRGQVLFELGGNELIELQQQFSETASLLKRVKAEFNRVQLLYSENVSTEKEFLLAESEYKTTLARFAALKTKAAWIGLDTAKIESGNFYSTFALKSPINGHITEISVMPGQYVDQQTGMASIIDATALYLHLSVFEKDVTALQPGQKIICNLIDQKKTIFEAKLTTIGKTVDPESKTIDCFGEIDNPGNGNFVNNAYLEAQIVTETIELQGVPSEAVLYADEKSYLLKLAKKENGNYLLEKIQVKTGMQNKGFIEIMDQTGNDDYLLSGVYNILIE